MIHYPDTTCLGYMIEHGRHIRVMCTGCREWRDLDLVALAEKVGPEYSLYNRRCRCRLTPGCEGWNKFHIRKGAYRPFWDHETSLRWMKMPR